MQTDIDTRVIDILIVDDTRSNLEVVMELLTSEGYSVSIATSGERALKQLKIKLPTLILLDVQMPGMDGFEACQQIKTNNKTSHIPIIFITASSNVESISKGFESGAVDYINKPFHNAELLARVKTHLQLQRMKQSLETQVQERTAELTEATAQLQTALDQVQNYQLQLIKQEKMSALGNLVAGVAHEINNPLGFLGGNIAILKDHIQDLTEFIRFYDQLFPTPDQLIQAKRRHLEIDYVLEDLPNMLTSMDVGCDRIRQLSNSLRLFSRSDMEKILKTSLHEGLDSALLILKYRLGANHIRPAIEVIKDYGNVPEVDCYPGQLNQVFMNILANAIDMFDELAAMTDYETLEAAPQTITLRTRLLKQQHTEFVEISIADNGKGMSEEICSKIFSRNFTTKEVGKGTGLGLAIAHQIAVDTHGGSLDVQSEVGRGTEFRIRLPLSHQP